MIYRVPVEVRTRAAYAWIAIVCVLARLRLIGDARAYAWAQRGTRLAKYRIAGGPWRRFCEARHRGDS